MRQTGNNCLSFRHLLLQALAPRVTLSPHGAAPAREDADRPLSHSSGEPPASVSQRRGRLQPVWRKDLRNVHSEEGRWQSWGIGVGDDFMSG